LYVPIEAYTQKIGYFLVLSVNVMELMNEMKRVGQSIEHSNNNNNNNNNKILKMEG
jgi:hypothetical protein